MRNEETYNVFALVDMIRHWDCQGNSVEEAFEWSDTVKGGFQRAIDRPLDMVLHCPACGLQHIDAPEGDWENPPHKSHLCHGCGHIWRPADFNTNGVAAVKTKGEKDSPVVKSTGPRPGTLEEATAYWRRAKQEFLAVSREYLEGPSDPGTIVNQARYWRALMELAGHWQDGSDQAVRLFQDDATRSCLIKTGDDRHPKYYGADGRSFEHAIVCAIEEEGLLKPEPPQGDQP